MTMTPTATRPDNTHWFDHDARAGMNRQQRTTALPPFLRQHVASFIVRQRPNDLEHGLVGLEMPRTRPRAR